MTKYTLLVYGKNKKTIDNFLIFLKKTPQQNFQILKKQSKITRFSVLKSPHINKKAQEHFQFIQFCISLSFVTTQLKKKLLFLKKIKNQLFPDLKVVIKGTYLGKTKSINFFSPNDTIIYNQKKVKLTFKFLLKKSLFYLKVLDYYGNQAIKV